MTRGELQDKPVLINYKTKEKPIPKEQGIESSINDLLIHILIAYIFIGNRIYLIPLLGKQLKIVKERKYNWGEYY
jgi:hypothetical protein